MSDLNEKDFQNLKWPLHQLPLSEKCLDSYADLSDIFLEFKNYKTDSLTNDLVVRFIVFCYDRKSPFVEKMENILERKIAVLNYLKVPDKNGQYAEDIQRIIKSNDSKTAKLIYQFCKFQDSLTYFALVTTVEVYISMNEKLGNEMDGAKESKDTADTMIKLEKIEDRIEKLSNKLFKRDADLKDFIGSVLVVEGRKRKIFPEDWSE